jgi:hypothetical protein
MNERIRRMKQQIESRGGTVYFPQDAPDDILEMFLEEVLDCPCCADVDIRPKARVRKAPRGH